MGRSVWPLGLAVGTWPVRVRAREEFFLRFLLPGFSEAWAGRQGDGVGTGEVDVGLGVRSSGGLDATEELLGGLQAGEGSPAWQSPW